MDLAALSIGLSQGKLAQQVSLSVAKIGMNTTKQQGQALTELLKSAKIMEQSVNPHIGSTIDTRM